MTYLSTRMKISQPETQLLQLGYDALDIDAPFKLKSGDPRPDNMYHDPYTYI